MKLTDVLREERKLIQEAGSRAARALGEAAVSLREEELRVRYLETAINNAIEAIERGSTTAPVAESLKAAIGHVAKSVTQG